MYDGCGGVPSSGDHAGAATGSGLPSLSALRIAVTGRTKLYSNLLSQAVINASAIPMFKSAIIRAFSASELPCASATPRAMLFQWPGGWTVPEGPAQKRAMSVCSAVRVVLFEAPIALIWLKAAVNSGESSDGGGAARNWSGEEMPNGSTVAHCGSAAGAKAG